MVVWSPLTISAQVEKVVFESEPHAPNLAAPMFPVKSLFFACKRTAPMLCGREAWIAVSSPTLRSTRRLKSRPIPLSALMWNSDCYWMNLPKILTFFPDPYLATIPGIATSISSVVTVMFNLERSSVISSSFPVLKAASNMVLIK